MMLIKKIRAFFARDDESVEMDIVAAEIKEGKAYLHPKEDPKKTYFIRADDIKILLNEGRSILSQNIFFIISYNNKFFIRKFFKQMKKHRKIMN